MYGHTVLYGTGTADRSHLTNLAIIKTDATQERFIRIMTKQDGTPRRIKTSALATAITLPLQLLWIAHSALSSSTKRHREYVRRGKTINVAELYIPSTVVPIDDGDTLRPKSLAISNQSIERKLQNTYGSDGWRLQTNNALFRFSCNFQSTSDTAHRQLKWHPSSTRMSRSLPSQSCRMFRWVQQCH